MEGIVSNQIIFPGMRMTSAELNNKFKYVYVNKFLVSFVTLNY